MEKIERSGDVGPKEADPLPGLRNQLAEEYGGSVPPETIDRIARQSLSEFGDARVKEFVAVFALASGSRPAPRHVMTAAIRDTFGPA